MFLHALCAVREAERQAVQEKQREQILKAVEHRSRLPGMQSHKQHAPALFTLPVKSSLNNTESGEIKHVSAPDSGSTAMHNSGTANNANLAVHLGSSQPMSVSTSVTENSGVELQLAGCAFNV